MPNGFLERIVFNDRNEKIKYLGKILAVESETTMRLVRTEWKEPVTGDSAEDLIENVYRAKHFEPIIIVHYLPKSID